MDTTSKGEGFKGEKAMGRKQPNPPPPEGVRPPRPPRPPPMTISSSFQGKVVVGGKVVGKGTITLSFDKVQMLEREVMRAVREFTGEVNNPETMKKLKQKITEVLDKEEQ